MTNHPEAALRALADKLRNVVLGSNTEWYQGYKAGQSDAAASIDELAAILRQIEAAPERPKSCPHSTSPLRYCCPCPVSPCPMEVESATTNSAPVDSSLVVGPPDSSQGIKSSYSNYSSNSVDSSQGEPSSPQVAVAFDMLSHLQRQREWSERTFGPGSRTAGVVDHIRKELCEIEADPLDPAEWVDVVILGLDGAWRCGWSPEQIIAGIVAKQTRNEGRQWPDWRTADTEKAIEHTKESQ